MSLNRWVFKWRLKVRMFLHSRMSAGKRVPGGWSSNRKSATGQFSSVCMQERRASEERRARGGVWVQWRKSVVKSGGGTRS